MRLNAQTARCSVALLVTLPYMLASQTTPDPSRWFRTSDACLACHNSLTTASGADVSIGADWRASMMANAARDPYWQAAVRREIIDHPTARKAIEDTCSTCHMPMTRFASRQSGSLGGILAYFQSRFSAPNGRFAVDGVSCTTCHQIEADKLGTPASFTGGFVIDTTRRWPHRRIYGPFDVDTGRITIMRSATSFRPTQAPQISSSALCGTCHTLFTEALNSRGDVVGQLPEQMPFREWEHSSYRNVRSCQSCHMPVVGDSTAITSVMGQPRGGFSRHVFRGGNFFVIRMLNRYRDELNVEALPQELEAEASRTIEHLQTLTARVTLDTLALVGRRVVADVLVENLAGHKLPTAYPSRRAWLDVEVHDATGRTVFQSGALRRDGSIEGNDNDISPARFEPHYELIDRADQVQIYEAIMVDPADGVTTGLLSAVRFEKDNRLLPQGFDKNTAPAEIAVRGAARTDTSFVAARDRVRYSMDIGDAPRPLTVDVRLWYQPIGFRWAQNLVPYDAFETRRFVSYFNAMAESSALVLASATATLR
ncbi:MAG TPA: hypothetical protein VFT29_07110 [Gemmatimonadaceae bacterium]|nr:hypothetical protein [Gemmatimonadaceae bacterium]